MGDGRVDGAVEGSAGLRRLGRRLMWYEVCQLAVMLAIVTNILGLRHGDRFPAGVYSAVLVVLIVTLVVAGVVQGRLRRRIAASRDELQLPRPSGRDELLLRTPHRDVFRRAGLTGVVTFHRVSRATQAGTALLGIAVLFDAVAG